MFRIIDYDFIKWNTCNREKPPARLRDHIEGREESTGQRRSRAAWPAESAIAERGEDRRMHEDSAAPSRVGTELEG